MSPADRRFARGSARSAVAVALAACVAAPDPGPLDSDYADQAADGCGGALDEPEVYQALPLVFAPPEVFTFAMLDIGQGDASVLKTPSGCAAMFDRLDHVPTARFVRHCTV